MKILYLNNSGHRWVVYNRDGSKPKIFVNHKKSDGANVVRTAVEFRAFGNFATALYYYKGKRHETLNYALLTDKKIPNS